VVAPRLAELAGAGEVFRDGDEPAGCMRRRRTVVRSWRRVES